MQTGPVKKQQKSVCPSLFFLNTLEREILDIFIEFVASVISQFLINCSIFNKSRDKVTR